VLRRGFLAVVALLAVLAVPVQASGEASQAGERPSVAAAAWYLVGEDGVLLDAHRAREKRAIASITKLMTTIVALERARSSDLVRVPPAAVAIGGSTGELRAGELLTVTDLVRATLVPSGNDAAEALALHVGDGSVPAFVRLMNEKARELGLTDTTFRNPHGLDEAGHVSSARDATLLVRHALGIPVLRDALERSTVRLGARELETTSDLNGAWRRFIGGKTGHTDDAGWSEAAAARGGGATVYGTVLGSDTRAERNTALRTLLQFGLRQYGRAAVVDATRAYTSAETGYGAPDVELVAPRTLVRTVRRGVPLLERVVAPRSVGIPVRKGTRLGRVEIYAGDRLLASSNLVAAADVAEPGALDKAWWYVETTAGNFVELFS
jgi:D-alanyl-D-alanine carboxypeptidase (penicillin-binding protein 5/6)